jgi:hypothetical protein
MSSVDSASLAFSIVAMSFLNRSEEATVQTIRAILRSAQNDPVPAVTGQIILQLRMAL